MRKAEFEGGCAGGQRCGCEVRQECRGKAQELRQKDGDVLGTLGVTERKVQDRRRQKDPCGPLSVATNICVFSYGLAHF